MNKKGFKEQPKPNHVQMSEPRTLHDLNKNLKGHLNRLEERITQTVYLFFKVQKHESRDG